MNREKLAENGLKANIPAFADRNILLKKLVVGVDLELDEVGWLAEFSRPGSSAVHWKQNIRHR